MLNLKTSNFDRLFIIYIIIFVLALSVAIYARGGRDLKVDIYGAQQALNKDSIYKNPTGDDPRPLFRYAPGFAIMVYPFILTSQPYKAVRGHIEIDGIMPSVFAWYFFKILLLFLSAIILLKLIPCVSKDVALRNLKVSFMLALPLIGCELANGQNKILALFFMLLALWLFSRKKLFISALCFCLAATVHIPLAIFAVYFVLRNKKFILNLAAAALVVFFLLPSLVFGVHFNIYLLKEWFLNNIKPFCLTNSYATYADLRVSSQSLPSAIGRMFVSGYTGNFKYLISPFAVHAVIRAVGIVLLFFSCFASWKRLNPVSEGLCYILFFILSILLPQYSITYIWSWSLVFYFAVFNYISYPEVSHRKRKFMLALAAILFITSISISLKVCNRFSVLFWGTVILWAGIVGVLIKNIWRKPWQKTCRKS